MKRKINQISFGFGAIYAVADDGTWWRIIDPLIHDWVKMPDLPQPEQTERAETEARKRPTIVARS